MYCKNKKLIENTKISLQEKMHNNFIEIQIKSSRNGAQFVPIGML